MKRRLILAAAGATLSAGCVGPQPVRYASERPELDLRRYFDGRVDAWGMFTDRAGAVVKRFTVRMDCRWTGEEGVLEEDFTYSDGTKQRRVWHVTRIAPGRYTGRADDVVGEALGEQSGNALQWRYTLALPIDGRVWQVQFDDWMVLMDDRVLLNRAAMSKLGIHLGDVTLAFRKP